MFIIILLIRHAIENNTLSVLIEGIAGISVYAAMLLLIRDELTIQLFAMVKKVKKTNKSLTDIKS